MPRGYMLDPRQTAIISGLNRIWLRVYGETVGPLFFAYHCLILLTDRVGVTCSHSVSSSCLSNTRQGRITSPSENSISSIFITSVPYSHTIVAVLNSLALKPNACPSRC